jgi:tryptophanyl-tRNA synthetase
VTDSTNSVSYDPEIRPGVSNLLQMFAYFDPEGRGVGELANILVAQNANLKQLKEKVFEAVVMGLTPIRERYEQILLEGDAFLDDVAERGGRKASENAEETMVELRKALALERPAV